MLSPWGTTTIWTPAKIAQLKELWLSGMSTPLIAKKLGTTKNGVIGKAHRLKLPLHNRYTKSRDSAPPLGASGHRVKVQNSNPPSARDLEEQRITDLMRKHF